MFSQESLAFHFHRSRHAFGNYAALKLRHGDGAIVSMHQSGTHWLKFMLANAMAEKFSIAPPAFNHANDIIGGYKDPIIYPNIPRYIASHSIPPWVFKSSVIRRLAKLPPVVLLVRDIRSSLVSNYRKWINRYGLSFSDYLRGDPSGRRFNSDLWWCIRFLNAWGELAQAPRDRVLIVRYEALLDAPEAQLALVAQHLNLALDESAINHAVASATKSSMAVRADPERPPGEVNEASEHPFESFSRPDRIYLASRLEQFLRHDFGYNYVQWHQVEPTSSA